MAAWIAAGGATGNIPAALHALASKSLLQVRDGSEGEPRFGMLETIREYAREQLQARDGAGRLDREQARYFTRLAEDAERESVPLEAHFADEIGDEPLRLLFVCCHEAVPAESRVAIALRTLCGFSTAEIARALLTTDANVQKRIERARDRLRAHEEFDDLMLLSQCDRMGRVPGAPVPELAEALEYIRELDAMDQGDE